jgi:hypothetical protein
MSARRNERLGTELLAAYLDGEVPASERLAIDETLHEDPGARKRLAQLRHIGEALSAPVPELESIDMAARVRAALAKPAPEAKSGKGQLVAWCASLAVAASVGLFFAFGLEPHHDAQFRAKSVGAPGDQAERWAGVQIHRVVSPKKIERLKTQLGMDDGLLFSYSNIGPAPFGYLMIFGVQADGSVRWFHPSYEQADSDPSSIAIEREAGVSLGDVISHDYSPGELSIHALFTREPLKVSEVERWLVTHPELDELPLPDASVQSVKVQVAR